MGIVEAKVDVSPARAFAALTSEPVARHPVGVSRAHVAPLASAANEIGKSEILSFAATEEQAQRSWRRASARRASSQSDRDHAACRGGSASAHDVASPEHWNELTFDPREAPAVDQASEDGRGGEHEKNRMAKPL